MSCEWRSFAEEPPQLTVWRNSAFFLGSQSFKAWVIAGIVSAGLGVVLTYVFVAQLAMGTVGVGVVSLIGAPLFVVRSMDAMPLPRCTMEVLSACLCCRGGASRDRPSVLAFCAPSRCEKSTSSHRGGYPRAPALW